MLNLPNYWQFLKSFVSYPSMFAFASVSDFFLHRLAARCPKLYSALSTSPISLKRQFKCCLMNFSIVLWPLAPSHMAACTSLFFCILNEKYWHQ